MLKISSLCAAMIIGLSTAAMAQTTATETTAAVGRDGTPRYDVGTFDVAGIELGMTPDQVRAVMQEKGFSVVETAVPRHLTYAGLVHAQATRLNRPKPDLTSVAGPAEMSGTDAGRNRLTVRFVQTRDGPRVSTIRLTFDRNTNDFDRLEADLFDRYGRPSRKMFASHGSHWCSIGGNATCDVSSDRGAPKLSFSPSISATLTLTNVEAMTAARDAEIAALFDAPTGERQRSLLGS